MVKATLCLNNVDLEWLDSHYPAKTRFKSGDKLKDLSYVICIIQGVF